MVFLIHLVIVLQSTNHLMMLIAPAEGSLDTIIEISSGTTNDIFNSFI
jgi:hypothetical protein